MKNRKHLYNTKSGKIFWFVKRFGVSQIFMKPLRMFFSPLIVPLLKKGKFIFENKEYSIFYDTYNTTWANERAVEIPIIYEMIKKCNKKVLEIGNVLSHYYTATWDILDKFEKGEKIINKDIINFLPKRRYDLIVSISTFEHIGFDDDSSDKSYDRIMSAYENIKNNCLNKKGKIVMTIPIGYNPDIDKIIFDNEFKLDKQKFLKRVSKREWKEVKIEEAAKCRYGRPFPYANAVMIGSYQMKFKSKK